MKPTLSVFPLLVAAATLLPLTVYAAPHAGAQTKHRKRSPAKSRQQSHSAQHFRPTGRLYILNAARPGMEPNRGDHMAIGRGMHPEQMDHMNAATPVPPAPKR